MIFMIWIVKIVIMICSVILLSITIKKIDKCEKKYKYINIDEWKDMNVFNMKLKKKKSILEREVIQIILQDDENDKEILK